MIRKVEAAVMFVREIDRSLTFYRDTVGLQVTHREPNFASFRMEGQDFAVLERSEGAQMIGREAGAPPAGGDELPMALLCAPVDDVDAVYATLQSRGATCLKPPESQPWGRRTAYFADPDDNVWEIFQELAPEREA